MRCSPKEEVMKKMIVLTAAALMFVVFSVEAFAFSSQPRKEHTLIFNPGPPAAVSDRR